MITKITLKNTASYIDQVDYHPNQINYIYGSNGTGKTTISKVIASPSNFPNCAITLKIIFNLNP